MHAVSACKCSVLNFLYDFVMCIGLVVNDCMCLCNYFITNTCKVVIKMCVHVLQDGDTPLHWAAYSGHNKAIEILIAAGATVDAKDRVS